jgi:hypothetical protein
MMKAMKLRILPLAILSLVLVACSPATTVRNLVRSAPLPVPNPIVRIVDRGAAAPASAEQAAIQQVIERANAAQAQAFATGKPSLMADTATSAYYQEMEQTNRALADGGVTRIELIKLEWGPISVSGAAATATTFETWRTTYRDGTTDQSRDRNVYQLVKSGGAWKIAADSHPDSGLDQPGATAPGSPAPSAPSAPGGPGTAPAQPAPAAAPTRDTSRNWSGYAATGGTFTAVSGTWTVPEPATGASGAGATWVGIGGVRGRDLIQAGTQETVSASGRVQYRAWIETLPQASRTVSLAVHPGDSVTVSLAEQSGGDWQVRLRNNTTGQTYEETVTYDSARASAEWVHEAPSSGRTILPIDNFGTVIFSAASAVKDGKTVNLAQAGAQPVTMINANREALAVPSQLTRDGAGFSVSRTDTPATGQGVPPGASPGRRRGGS